jgi:hypothetical protein
MKEKNVDSALSPCEACGSTRLEVRQAECEDCGCMVSFCLDCGAVLEGCDCEKYLEGLMPKADDEDSEEDDDLDEEDDDEAEEEKSEE